MDGVIDIRDLGNQFMNLSTEINSIVYNNSDIYANNIIIVMVSYILFTIWIN